MAGMTFYLLGQQAAFDGAGRQLVLPAMVWPLVGNLLCAPKYTMSRQALAGTLWPEHEECLARHNLASVLCRIKGRLVALGACFRASKSTVELCPDFVATIDVVRFEAVVAEKLRDPAALATRAGRDDLRVALDRYVGDFLPQLSDVQVQIERERLRALYLDAGLEYVRACCRNSEWRAACEVARGICAVEPFREDAQRMLMQSLVGCGNEASALQAYRTFEQLLGRELGVQPAHETRAIADAIQRRIAGPVQAPAVSQSPPPPSPRRILSEVRCQISGSLGLLDQVLAQPLPGESPPA